MIKTCTCWTCWKKTSVFLAKPLLYLIACHYLIRHETISDTYWFLRVILRLCYSTTILIITTVILNLVFRPTWFDEESPDQHCHILDTRDKMARELARMMERLAEARVEFRAVRLFVMAGDG